MIRPLLLLAALSLSARAEELLLYCGSYTGGTGKAKGITLLKFDTATGRLTSAGTAAETPSPSFLAFDASGQFLYSTNEPVNAVSAFRVNSATGALTALNRVEVSEAADAGPCHLAVDSARKNVIAANYGGGSVSVIGIKPDGSLEARRGVIQHTGSGPDQQRQKEPHAHGVVLGKGNDDRVFVSDLGTDKVHLYRFDPEAGKLTPAVPDAGTLPPGSGPRHTAWHPEYAVLYCINELTSTITVMDWVQESGKLTAKQTLTTLPDGWKGSNSTAEIVVHPGGKFVYGSNRGHDSIAAFRVTGPGGELTPLGQTPTGGRNPRNFTIDPTGRWLLAANQGTHDIFVFSIDQATGELKSAGGRVEVGSPVCLLFPPKAPK